MTNTDKEIDKFFKENTITLKKGVAPEWDVLVVKDIAGFCTALTQLLNSEVEKARYAELAELNFQIAKNGWHDENAFKMFPYIAKRLVQLNQGEKNEKV